jgi:molybdopterin molybdotransferase
MITASEAVRIVLENAPMLSSENVDTFAALGRTTSQDIRANEDLPPFDNSSMDGFAIRSSARGGAGQTKACVFRLVGESSAGKRFPGRIRSGEAVRIMTGGMMPEGAEAVVPIERARELDDEHVAVLNSIRHGQYVRKRGEDVRRGEVVMPAGRPVTPGSMGLLASLGFTRVHVRKRPTVAIIASGDELVEVGDRLLPGEIRNGTSAMLAADVIREGGMPLLLGIVSDNREMLRRRIRKALGNDMVIVTGGVSVGKYDYVKSVLKELRVRIKFWRVNIKPGMPLVFGTHKGTLVFGLPGNPVSTGVTFLQFVRPALRRMLGREDLWPMRHTAILSRSLNKSDGKRHYLRGIARQKNGKLHVTTTGTQSSGAMSSLSKGNCLIIVPEKVTRIKQGDTVEVEFL